ncbi:MAG TPA: nucleotide exchange factor GrpE, partial [Gemmatimonadales bacterium]|nr:nucleotide exchange factor GrpE [Gemmatimonadales bacterium]
MQDDPRNDQAAAATAQDVVDAAGQNLPAEPPEQAMQRIERELSEARDRHLRLAAEFDNYKKRIARERTELFDRAQANFIGRLLEVLDDLDRLVAEDNQTSAESFRQAATLIDRKLRKELEAAGVERVDPAGQVFNPAVHEAVSTTPAPSPEQA